MTPARRMTRQEAEDFVYREARLLDSGQLEEWLELFTPDGTYWVPIDEHADPTREPSVIFDDRVQRSKRVYQLLHGPRYAQMPPSRTIHFVSNVEVDTTAPDGEVWVRCNSLVFELRPGDHQDLQVSLGSQRTFATSCVYRLRYDEEHWAIALKQVLLLNRDLPLYNLTFII